MSTPGIQDFQLAIGQLSVCCSDEELRDGQAEYGPLETPLVYVGNFGCVFKVHVPATGNSWAVKCFTRDIPGWWPVASFPQDALGRRYDAESID